MEQYTNLASSTLASAVIAGSTTLTLSSGASFPTGSFTILVENELIRVTSRASNVLTVTRGAEGTTAAGHASAVAVIHVITAQVFNNIRGEINSFGSTLPTSPRAGNRHTFTDGTFSLYDGTAWQDYYRGFLVKRPVLANFGFFVDPGLVTFTQVGNVILASSNGSSDQANFATLFGKTLTGTQVTIGIDNLYSQAESHGSLGIADSSNVFIDLMWGSAGGVSFYYVLGHPSVVAFGSVYNSANVINQGVIFLRIRIAGGNRYFEVSFDNVNFSILHSQVDGTLMTQTRLVFGHVRRTGNTISVSGTKIFHFEEV